MKKSLMLLFFTTAALALFAEPKTIYVDQKVATSGDGTSWETAVKTIQEGVDAAATGDTVLVAPGVYGGVDDCKAITVSSKTQKTSVFIPSTKSIHLLSSEGKEKTFIVGHRGDGVGGVNPEDGQDPVMCVMIESGSGSKNTMVEGFTICNGEMATALGSNGPAGVGYPWLSSFSAESSNQFYVVHCTISNCCAQRASAMRGGTAISTLFTENRSWTLEKGSTDTAMYIFAYNCIFTCSGTVVPGATAGHSCMAYIFKLVNCTVVNNLQERGVTGNNDGNQMFNVASVDNGKGGDNTAGEVYTCVFDGGAASTVLSKKTMIDDTYCLPNLVNSGSAVDHEKLFMGACVGDFRPVAGGLLADKGKIEYTRLPFIPPRFKQTDFYGNRIADDAQIPIGAILPKATPVTAPVKIQYTDILINGWHPYINGQFIHSDVDYRTLDIRPADPGVLPHSLTILNTSLTDEIYYPLRTTNFFFVMRGKYQGGETNTLVYYMSDGAFYVDRENGLDTNDGSANAPFQSLQKAVTSIPSKSRYTIFVAEGVYDNESATIDSWATPGKPLSARVLINAEVHALIWATGDRDKTVLQGLSDETDAADSVGVGPDALRCLIIGYSSGRACLSGMTVRGGRTKGAEDGRGNMGGAVLCNKEYSLVAQDCVFTDNAAASGSAGYFTAFLRCRFHDNLSKDGAGLSAKCVASRGYASSCVFEDNKGDPGLIALGNDLYSCNCTVYQPKQSSDSPITVSSTQSRNSILWSNGYMPDLAANTGSLTNCIVWGSSDVRYKGGVFSVINPKMPNRRNGDYSLRNDSPALEELAGTFDDKMARRVFADYNGNPLRFTEDGRITLGAVHTVSASGIPGMLLLFR